MEFRKKEYKPFDIFDSEWAAIIPWKSFRKK